MQGYVYILLNSSLPGLVKVGKTTKQPDARARELHQTGVPSPFVVAYSEFVSDCDALELQIHTELNAYRETSRREFFRIDSTSVIKLLIEAARNYRIEEESSEYSENPQENAFYVYHLAPHGYEEQKNELGYISFQRDVLDNDEIIDSLGSKWGAGARERDTEDLIKFYPRRGSGPHKHVYRFGFTTSSSLDLARHLQEYFNAVGIHACLTRKIYDTNYRGFDFSEILYHYRSSIVSKREQLLYLHESELGIFVSKMHYASREQEDRVERQIEMLNRQRTASRLRGKV
jgi:hypothetical protein